MRFIFGTIALLWTLPRVAYQCLKAWNDQKQITMYVSKLAGKNQEYIQHRTLLVANKALVDFDRWFLYMRGKFDLIGPKALDHKQAQKLGLADKIRLKVAPGIISPYQIKCQSGIAHLSEQKVANDFAINANMSRRLQILLIHLIQTIFTCRSKPLSSPTSFKLLDVRLSNLSMQESVARVIRSLCETTSKDGQDLGKAKTFAFVNADCVNKYYEDANYKKMLNNFDTVFADGVGVKIAARWRGIGLKENVNGTDMFPLLCEQLSSNDKSVYLLGATKSAVSTLAAKFGRLFRWL